MDEFDELFISEGDAKEMKKKGVIVSNPGSLPPKESKTKKAERVVFEWCKRQKIINRKEAWLEFHRAMSYQMMNGAINKYLKQVEVSDMCVNRKEPKSGNYETTCLNKG